MVDILTVQSITIQNTVIGVICNVPSVIIDTKTVALKHINEEHMAIGINIACFITTLRKSVSTHWVHIINF